MTIREYQELLGFDSKLVRLKDAAMLSLKNIYLSFDSKLVRLKAFKQWFLYQPGDPFRFQTGSIKSFCFKGRNFFFECFDSKLVRLKAQTLAISMDLRERVSIPNWFD